MPSSLTDTLCTRCGLCCDGTLFADVELGGRAEATSLEILGLEIEEGDGDRAVLVQPCRALHGTRCSIYAHRPKCCRTFECHLLQSVRREDVSVERAQELIAETHRELGQVTALLARLGPRDPHLPLREACAEALAREPSPNADVARTQSELEVAMSALHERIRTTFLGEGSRSRAGRKGR